MNDAMGSRTLSYLLDPPPSQAGEPLLARVLGFLFVAGGLLGSISLVLPHPAQSNLPVLWAQSVGAFVVGCGFLALANRVPMAAIHATVALGSVLITTATYFTGFAAGFYSLMYFWVALFAGYFFSLRAAMAQITWLLACYLVVLALIPSSGISPISRWIMTAVSLLIVGGLTSWLVTRRAAAEIRGKQVFDLSSDMLCTANQDGYFVELNYAWTRTLGYSEEELCRRPFIELVHPDDRERTEAESAGIYEERHTANFENRYRAKDGSWRWLRWSSRLHPATGLVYARATDITDERRLMVELESQARTDSLTGLPNRRWLTEELDRELARARRQGFSLALAILDLDHFKRYNDEHGHPAGDKLLRDAAEAWQQALRASDFLCRYGGEEFIVLLPDCEAPAAHEVIARVLAATPAGQTCSAGIVAWDGFQTAEKLIADADSALYAAKQAGRTRIVVAGAPIAGVAS